MAAGIGKSRTGIRGFDELTLGGLPVRPAHVRLRQRGLRQDAVRRRFPRSRGGEHGEPGVFVLRGERPRDDQERRFARLRPRRSLRAEAAPHRPRCTWSRANSRRRASMISTASSSASRTPSERWARSGSSSTPSRRSSPPCRTRAILRSELRRLFAGSRTRGSPPSSPASAARARSPAVASRSTSPTVCLCSISGREPGCHAAPAHGQVSRLRPRHQRVPLPHPRARPLRAADTSLGLTHKVPRSACSTGIRAPRRHARRRGPLSGSSMLVSGIAGSGKSSLAASRRGRLRARRAAPYFAFEESPSQIVRNMRSIGVDLEPSWIQRGLLRSSPRARRCSAWRCTSRPCTARLSESRPTLVVVDPITNLVVRRDQTPRPAACCPAGRLPQVDASDRASSPV